MSVSLGHQEVGDYLIEYKKFPIFQNEVEIGMGMSAALQVYSLRDMGRQNIKGQDRQVLEVEGGTIRKQVTRINGTDDESMAILLKDLQDNETHARLFNKAPLKTTPLTREFKGETIRLDRME